MNLLDFFKSKARANTLGNPLRGIKALVWLTAFIITTCVYSNPSLDHVASGNVSYSQTQNTTTINQTSQKAILNWHSFNIGSGERTHFQQPAGGVALNRISPLDGASKIYGQLTATGQIILVNPAGVYFGPGSYVNVGGLIATTANITNQDFLNGNYRFVQDSNPLYANSAIVNEGKIIAHQHGLVALVGPQVINNGVIEANLGNVVLASGNAFTVNFDGSNLINFTIDSPSAGKQSGVRNTGTLMADGGKIIVTAKTASTVLDHVINMEGVAQARSVGVQNGEIILSADNEVKPIRVAAKIDVSGKARGERGGKVKITGQKILVDNGTTIDASGDVGGGEILIGGNYQGKGPLANAEATVIMPGTLLLADAITHGNGGNIVVWSDDRTFAYGKASARGGKEAGNGGLVETSSHHYLDVNGFQVDTSAPNGKAGTWLLDPSDITISSGSNSNITASSPFQPSSQASNSILNVTTLTTALASGNVTVQTVAGAGPGTGAITVSTPITWTSPATLLLNAVGNIVINSGITASNGTLQLQAGALANTITTGASGTISVANFNLLRGTWSQVTASLPSFSVTGNFQINSGTMPNANASFIRAVSGTGTSGSPYAVADIYGLQGAGSTTTMLSTTHWSLNNNIDASVTSNWNSGQGFVPIGVSTAHMNGGLNGQGFVVSNLYINRPTGLDGVGLIGFAGGNTVTNIGVMNANITGSDHVGALAGWAGSGLITNSFSTGSVTGAGTSVGGLLGYSNSNTSTSYSGANVTNTGQYTGGLIGYTDAAVSNVYAYGNVSGASDTGGLIGRTAAGSTLSNSYSTGAVTGSGGTTGGLVGTSAIVALNSFWDTSTSGQPTISATGTGKTTTQLKTATTFSGAGWSIGTAPGSVSATTPAGTWLIFDGNTRPMLSNEINGLSPPTTSQFLKINTAHQLQLMGMALGGSFTVINNIDASGTTNNKDVWGTSAGGNGFLPIGNSTTLYNGAFNGGSFNISNLSSVRSSTDNVALFGMVNSAATISNVRLLNATMTGNISVGALVGNNFGVVSNSFSSGAISGFNSIGGLVGFNNNNITTSNSSAQITVTGSAGGGLVGNNFTGKTISNSFATGTVGGGGSDVGGLVGGNSGAISNSYASGNVTGSVSVGGFVGSQSGASPTITDSYALGNATGTVQQTGGFIGTLQNGTVSNSYSTGLVTGAAIQTGGFVGSNLATVQNSFWDITTSGRSSGVGINSGTATTLVGGCFTGSCAGAVVLGRQSTYTGAGWNFTTNWFMPNYGDTVLVNTRPFLNMEASNTITNLHQLQMMAKNLGNSYTLSNALDLSTITSNNAEMWGGSFGKGFIPVGTSASPFTGSLNGGSYTLSNLNIINTIDRVGLLGSTSNATISNIFLQGPNVAGANSVGSLVGYMSGGTLTNAGAANVVVTSNTTYGGSIGGLIGQTLNTTISKVYSIGSVTGNAAVGGLIGTNLSFVDQAMSAGTVTGTGNSDGGSNLPQYIGGLAGINNQVGGGPGSISNSISMTNVFASGSSSVGGLVGFNNNIDTIDTSLSVGVVLSGSAFSGGLVGANNGSSLIRNSYYDIGTSGAGSTVCGVNSCGTPSSGTTPVGASTATLMTQGNYTNWDFFGTWSIIPGQSYPYLKTFYTSTPRAVSGTYTNTSGGSIGYNVPLQMGSNGTAISNSGLTQGTTTTFNNGFYYYLMPNGAVANNNSMVIARSSGGTANAITVIPSSNGSITGLNLVDGGVRVGDDNTNNIASANAYLGTAKGTLSNILYSVSGNNLTITGSSFGTTTNTTYNLLGNISFSPNGTVIFNGPVAVNGSAVAINAGTNDITFNNTIDGTSGQTANLSLNSSGVTTIANGSSVSDHLTSLSTDSGGSTVINGDITTIGGGQTYLDAVRLTNDVTLTASGAGNSINFGNTVNSFDATARNLNIHTGNAPVGFLSTVGNSFALGDLFVSAGGETLFQSTVAARSVTTATGGSTRIQGNITTTGSLGQFYDNNVGINNNVTLTAGTADIGFAGTLNGFASNFSLTLNTSGNTTFYNTVGNSVPLSALITDSGGLTSITGGQVKTTGNQTYGDNVIIADGTVAQGPTTLQTTANGNIAFNGTVDGDNGSLTIQTGAGTVNFGSLVGFSSPFSSISTTGTGLVTFADAVGSASSRIGSINIAGPSNINGLQMYTSGTQTYTGAVNLSQVTSFNTLNNNVHFGSTVNGGGLSLDTGLGNINFDGSIGQTSGVSAIQTYGANTVTFGSLVGSSFLPVGVLDIAGNTVINDNIYAGTSQNYGGNVLLNGGHIVTLTTNAPSGTITFGGTVDSVHGNEDLAIGSDTVTFNGEVGFGSQWIPSLFIQANNIKIKTDGIATSGDQYYAGPVSLQADSTLTSDTGSISFDNAINSVGGQYALTLFFSNDANFNGAIGSGTPLKSLEVTNSNLVSSTIHFTNTPFVITTDDQTYNDHVVLDGTTIAFQSNSGNINFNFDVDGANNTIMTVNNALSNSGISGVLNGVSFGKTGAGDFTLSSTNLYTGGTSLFSGKLISGADNAFGTGFFSSVGGTLDLKNHNQSFSDFSGIGAVTNSGGSMVDLTVNNSIDDIFMGVISGNLAFNKTNTGKMTLTNANTYTGQTTISQGTLDANTLANAGSASAIGSGSTNSNIQISNGGKLLYTGASTASNRPFTLGTGGGNIDAVGSGTLLTLSGNIATAGNTLTLNPTLANLIYSGVISGGGSMIKNGAGTLTLNAVNTYTGTTTMNAGGINIGIDDALPVKPLAMEGGQINLNDHDQHILDLSGTNSSAVILNSTLNTKTLFIQTLSGGNVYKGMLGGNMNVVKSGSGSLQLDSGSNSYTGTMTINGGSLLLGVDNALPIAAGLVVNSGATAPTLNMNGHNQTVASLNGTGGQISNGGGVIKTLIVNSSGSDTYSGVISGDIALTKDNSGSLTLSGSNSYIGATTINAGTLQLGADNVIDDRSAIVFLDVSGANLNLAGFSDIVGSLSGGGTTGGNIHLGGGNLTFGFDNSSQTYNGAISDTGSLNKIGTGLQILGGNNSGYSGSTTISTGRLSVTNNNALGTGSATVNSGATLQVNSGTTITNALFLSGTGSASQGALVASGNGTGTASGAITLQGGATTLGTLSAADQLILGTIDGGQALSLIGSGSITLGNVGANTRLTSIASTTATTLGGANVRTTDSQTYSNPVTLAANVAINSTTNNGAISFGTVTRDSSARTLTIDSGSGAITLNTTGTSLAPLGAITLNSTGATTLANTIFADSLTTNALGTTNINTTGITTSGAGGQVYHDTVVLGSTSTLSAGTGPVTFDGTINSPLDRALTVNTSGITTFGGTIGGSQALAGLTTDAGGTTIIKGNIFTNSSAGQSYGDAVELGANVILNSDPTNTGVKPIAFAATGSIDTDSITARSLTINAGASSITLSGAIGSGVNGAIGALNLNTSGTGTIANTVNAASLTTNSLGTTAINGGSIITSGNQTYNDNMTLGAASTTLQATAGNIVTNAINGNNNVLIIDNGGAAGSIGGVISNVNSFTKDGAGILTFGAANTYTGSTTITNGTLRLGLAGAINDTTQVIINAPGIFDLNNFSETIGSFSGSGDVSLGSGTLTTGDANNRSYSGSISGTGGLIKQGSGFLALSGGNTYSGNTTINAGIIRLLADDVIDNNSKVVLANTAGVSFDVNGHNDTIGSLSGGGTTGGVVSLGAGRLTFGNAIDDGFGGVISGTGGITKIGASNFTLNNVNTYTGSTLIDAGTLTLGIANAIDSASDVNIATGATLGLGNFNYTMAALSGDGNINLGSGNLTVGDNTNSTYNGSISGTGALIKEGTGTLTFTNTNGYTGTTTINNGTLQMGVANALDQGNDVTINAGSTFDINGFDTTVGSVNGFGALSLGSGVLTMADNSDTAISGAITGSGGIIKQGSGIFTITGNNTGYSGTTTVNAGTLSVGNNNAIGSGQLNIGNSTLRASVSNTSLANTVNLTGNLSVTGTNNLSLTGAIGGSGNVTKTGSHILTLSGNNTYAGNTNINAGTLRLGADNVIPDSSAVSLTNATGVIFDVNGHNDTIASLSGGGTTGGLVTLGAGRLTLGDANDTSFAGVITGTGGLTKVGTGNFTLTNLNLYTGDTLINQGTLTIGIENAIDPTSDITIASGATLGLGNFNYTMAALSGDGNVNLGSGTLTVGDNTNSTYNGSISGTGALVKQGTGTLTFTNTNGYTGTTTINNGTLQMGVANALDQGNDVTINAGGTFDLNNFSTTVGSVNGAGALALGSGVLTMANNSDTTLSGLVSGLGGLTKQGTGVFTLSGNNLYSGTTTVNAGTLALGNNNALGTSLLSIGGSNLTATVNGLSVANTVNLTGNLSVTGTNNLSLTGAIGGSGNVTKTGSHILTLSGNNTYAGNTNINAGTLRLGADNVIPDSSAVSLTNAAGVIFDVNGHNDTIASLSGGGTTGGLVTLGAGRLTLGDANDTSFAGVITGTGGLTKVGTGNFTLTNLNLYTGDTLINQGTLTIGIENAIDPTSDITIASGATLGLGNFNYTMAALSGDGNVNLGSGTLTVGDNTNSTYNGSISGTGALVKQGTGTLTFTNSNGYTGTTTINNGTLQMGVANALDQANDVTINAGGLFDLNNFNTTVGSVNGAGALALGSGVLTMASNADTTLSGAITGSGSLLKQGSGVFTITGNNTGYSGNTTVNAGTLALGNNNALGTGALSIGGASLIASVNGINVANNIGLTGSTTVTGNNNLSLTGVVSGSGNLTKAGGSTLTLAGNNNYTGSTTVNDGVLSVAHDNGLGATSAGTSVNNAILNLNNAAVGNETITLNNGTLNGSGNASLTGQVLLTAASNNLFNANSGANLTIFGNVNGPAQLSIQGPGNVILWGNVGNLTKLTSFTAGNNTTLNALTIFTTGNQIYNNTLLLTGNMNFNSDSDVTFNGAIDGGLNDFSVTANTINFTGNMVKTTGNQTYTGNVKLAQDTTFATGGTGTKAITFNNGIDGNKNVILSGSLSTNEMYMLAGPMNVNQIVVAGGSGPGQNTVTVNTGNTQTWSINGNDAGTMTTPGITQLAYNNVQNITGGSGNDNFNYISGNVSGTINGGAGTNSITGNNANTWYVTGMNAGSLTGVNGFTNIQDLVGGSGNDSFILTDGALDGGIYGGGGNNSLTGGNTNNTWTITAANAGTLTNLGTGFGNIQNLLGNDYNDSFALNGGTVSGFINGGAGDNTLSADSVTNTWNLAGKNGGMVTGVNGGFSNIQNLAGNTSVDYFIFGKDSSVTGTISGGSLDANNYLNYMSYGSPVNVVLDSTHAGYAQSNGANIMKNFTDITHIINNVNFKNQLTLPANTKGNQLVFSSLYSGSINDPIQFSGFQSFQSRSSADTVSFGGMNVYTTSLFTSPVIIMNGSSAFTFYDFNPNAFGSVQTLGNVSNIIQQPAANQDSSLPQNQNSGYLALSSTVNQNINDMLNQVSETYDTNLRKIKINPYCYAAN